MVVQLVEPVVGRESGPREATLILSTVALLSFSELLSHCPFFFFWFPVADGVTFGREFCAPEVRYRALASCRGRTTLQTFQFEVQLNIQIKIMHR